MMSGDELGLMIMSFLVMVILVVLFFGVMGGLAIGKFLL